MSCEKTIFHNLPLSLLFQQVSDHGVDRTLVVQKSSQTGWIMSRQFSGKKLLVVGGTSGMGFQTARMVLEEGGSVVIVGNRPDKL